MKYIYPILGIAGIALLLIPSIMRLTGNMESEQMKNLMFLGTVLWFAGAIPWLGKKSKAEN